MDCREFWSFKEGRGADFVVAEFVTSFEVAEILVMFVFERFLFDI